MNNVLEFYVKMKDMMSSGLVKMAGTAQQVFSKVQGYANRVVGGNGLLSSSYDTIRQKIGELENTIRKSTSLSHIRSARKELEQLQRIQSRHPGNINTNTGGLAGGTLRSLLPALGITAMLATGGQMLTSGLEGQARQTSFEVMAGKESGTRLNQDLTRYAQDSIYGKEVYQNAQTMLGFGISDKDVMPNTKMLGDVAMGDANKLNSLTLAFSQVSAAGKLTGQDLLQFINAGFNPLQEIAKTTGLTIGELKKKVEEGAISFEMVKGAFQSATSEGGRFFDMTNKIAATDFGKVQAFQGQLDGLAMKIGGMLAPAFGDLISNYLAPFVNWLGDAATWIQENWNWIGLLVGVIGSAVVAYQAVILATNLWAAAQTLLNVAMTANPIGLIIAAIAGLVAGIVYAYNKFDWFRGAIYATWEAVKGFGLMIKDYVIDRIKGILSGLGGLASAIWKLLKGDFSGAWDSAKQAASDLIGLDAKRKAVERMKDIGKSASLAYQKGVSEVAEKNRETRADTSVSATEATTPSAANVNGLYDSLKTNRGKGKEESESTARGITSGGPRVININGVKFAEKIEIHAQTFEQGMDKVKDILDEYLLRLLNSGAKVQ